LVLRIQVILLWQTVANCWGPEEVVPKVQEVSTQESVSLSASALVDGER
jgi:hypothetical protein